MAGKSQTSGTVIAIRALLSAAATGLAVSFYIQSLDAAGVKGLDLANIYLFAFWIVCLIGTAIAESFLSWEWPKRLSDIHSQREGFGENAKWQRILSDQ